jgi:hypothetical protein
MTKSSKNIESADPVSDFSQSLTEISDFVNSHVKPISFYNSTNLFSICSIISNDCTRILLKFSHDHRLNFDEDFKKLENIIKCLIVNLIINKLKTRDT